MTPAAPDSAGAPHEESGGLDELLFKHSVKEPFSGPVAGGRHSFHPRCIREHPGGMHSGTSTYRGPRAGKSHPLQSTNVIRIFYGGLVSYRFYKSQVLTKDGI